MKINKQEQQIVGLGARSHTRIQLPREAQRHSTGYGRAGWVTVQQYLSGEHPDLDIDGNDLVDLLLSEGVETLAGGLVGANERVRLEHIPAITVLSELAEVDLHRRRVGLEVERDELTAHVPVQLRVEVRRCHAAAVRVDPRKLQLVVVDKLLQAVRRRQREYGCGRVPSKKG